MAPSTGRPATEQLADRVLTLVLAAARDRGVAVSAAVVDDVGSLLAFRRMDGAPRFSADFAVAKARTAATFEVATAELEDLYAHRPIFALSFVSQGGYFLGRGGVPLTVDGAPWGALGVSGADAHGEDELAHLGAAALA